jgi:hypothetical protein
MLNINHLKMKLLFLSLTIILFSYTIQAQEKDTVNGIITPSICEVFVNTDLNKFEIQWEEQDTNIIDFYNIYKVISGNDTYIQIGSVPYGTGYFIDYLSDVFQNTERYAITAGNATTETELSSYHQNTILNCTHYENSNYLIWEEYQGRAVSQYYIYRGMDFVDMELIDSVPAITTMYNDMDTYDPFAYAIGIVFEDTCSPDMATKIFAIDQPAKQTENIKVSVYPNPAKDYFKIKCNEKITTIELFSVNGKKTNFESSSLSNSVRNISLQNKIPGVYFIRISTNSGSYLEPVVIQ